ncbi:hypothetical protein HK099_003106 [Clydaea vesicula]|uniref:Uncharacterized protein n=1 Tax=Clydaea vesicula TaxID=447962 RepID=A0AAD5XRD4_9FUNG|nr:hypothetical protein HK099_003106 [Clydaea vesicula]
MNRNYSRNTNDQSDNKDDSDQNSQNREFFQEKFIRGRPDLLDKIQRKSKGKYDTSGTGIASSSNNANIVSPQLLQVESSTTTNIRNSPTPTLDNEIEDSSEQFSPMEENLKLSQQDNINKIPDFNEHIPHQVSYKFPPETTPKLEKTKGSNVTENVNKKLHLENQELKKMLMHMNKSINHCMQLLQTLNEKSSKHEMLLDKILMNWNNNSVSVNTSFLASDHNNYPLQQQQHREKQHRLFRNSGNNNTSNCVPQNPQLPPLGMEDQINKLASDRILPPVQHIIRKQGSPRHLPYDPLRFANRPISNTVSNFSDTISQQNQSLAYPHVSSNV